MKIVHICTFCVRVKNVDALLDLIEIYDKNNIWISALPSKLVLDSDILNMWIAMNLADFENMENRAKKPNINFLLRATGKTQIKDAIQLTKFKESEIVFLVVFSQGYDEKLCNKIKQDVINTGNEIVPTTYKADIKYILKVHQITNALADELGIFYESRYEAIKKLIIENSALAFLR